MDKLNEENNNSYMYLCIRQYSRNVLVNTIEPCKRTFKYKTVLL